MRGPPPSSSAQSARPMTLRPKLRTSRKGYLSARPLTQSATSAESKLTPAGTTENGSGTVSFSPARSWVGSIAGFAVSSALRPTP